MEAKVHHVGIAVPNLKKAAQFFSDVFGVENIHVESDQVKNLYIQFGDFYLQIMEDPGRLRGELFGRLDHVAINVENIDETVLRLQKYGVSMVWDKPVRAGQYRCNFTNEEGGVGVVFQLGDERIEGGEFMEFDPDMMADLSAKS